MKLKNMSTTTANSAKALSSTSDPLLDFHNFTTRGKNFDTLVPSLEAICDNRTYTYEDETFSGKYFLVKYLAYLRSFRNQGKGERALFISSLDWLSQHHQEIFDPIFDGGFIEKWGCWRDYLKLTNKNLRHRIVDKFANQLLEDVNNFPNISLCAKWAPSEGCAKGKNIFFKLVRTFVSLLREEGRSLKMGNQIIDLNIGERAIYRKVMTALRNQLNIVETHICQKNFNKINYDHLPGLAQSRYTKLFREKDEEGYTKWLNEKRLRAEKALSQEPSSSTEKIINVEALTLVDLIKDCNTTELGDIQFNIMLQKALVNNEWGNIIAVGDMSGSMENGLSSVRPIDVSLIMCLFSSCLSAHKNQQWMEANQLSLFKSDYPEAVSFLVGKWYSFSSNPKLNYNCAMWKNAEGETFSVSLSNMIKNVNRSDWEMNTNFEALYNAVIQEPENYDAMVVISDMQFDCVSTPNETNLENLKNRFRQAEKPMPKMVFWNINSSHDNVAASALDADVMIVSGFNHSVFKDIAACQQLTECPYNPLNNLLHILQNLKMD